MIEQVFRNDSEIENAEIPRSVKIEGRRVVELGHLAEQLFCQACSRALLLNNNLVKE